MPSDPKRGSVIAAVVCVLSVLWAADLWTRTPLGYQCYSVEATRWHHSVMLRLKGYELSQDGSSWQAPNVQCLIFAESSDVR